jgi:hypothetical protein
VNGAWSAVVRVSRSRLATWPVSLAILALVLATVSRLLEAHLGFPRAVNWLHFPIVVLAFALSLPRLRATQASVVAAHLALLGAFLASAWINGAGAINAALGYTLLAEPFLLHAALLGAKPTTESIRALGVWLLALAAVQIPVSLTQLPASFAARNPDLVQGTFQGMGPGHHVMAAVALTGALYLNRSFVVRPRWAARLVTGLLLALLVLSDSKQVMLAYSVAYVLLRAMRIDTFTAAWRLAASVFLILLAIYVALWSYDLHLFLHDARHVGRFAHKFVVFPILAAHFDSPVQWVLGVGPGHGVSRLGGWLLEHYWSVLEPLGATRTGIAAEAWAAGQDVGMSSLFAPLFSWAGIFGDVGLAGLSAYFALLWLAYRRAADDLSRLLLLAVAVLGFCFEWLEQFNLMLYVLAVVAQRTLHGSGRQEMPGRSPTTEGANR